jgi:arylsulfatase A-like enzyme
MAKGSIYSLNPSGIGRTCLLLLCALGFASLHLQGAARLPGSAAPAQPNVVIIYGDDVGYGDVGAYGASMIPTPNIDQLAAEGLRFTDGHCTAATCTPSRYSLLTGIHGFRSGVAILSPNAPLLISTEILTLPKLFQSAGYKTGVVGKWHLGLGEKGTPVDWNGEVKPGPLEIGFDDSFLLPSTNDRVPCVYLDGHRVLNLDPADPLYLSHHYAGLPAGSTVYPDGKKDRAAMTYYPSSHGHNHSVINGVGRIGYMTGGKTALWDDETMADIFVARARDFIAANKEQPFFLYFSSQDIHVPRTPHPRFQGTTKLSYRGDAMVQLDWSTGEIMRALEEHGLTENTIVIFSSDNGPVYDDGYVDGTTVKGSSKEVDNGHDASGVYRGGKYQIFEGGTRVPFIVRWPSRIAPGTSGALVSQIDFIASFANLLELELPDDAAVDSRDTLAAFLGEDPEGLPFMLEEAQRDRALRRGDWKFIQFEKRQALYNLEEDPSESKNCIAENPEIAESMSMQLQGLIESGRIR